MVYVSLTANNLKHAMVLVSLNRFQQIVCVYTFQAPNESTKVRFTLLHIWGRVGHNGIVDLCFPKLGVVSELFFPEPDIIDDHFLASDWII